MEVVGLIAAVTSIAKTAKTIAHFANQLHDAASNAPRIRDHILKSELSLRSSSNTIQMAQISLKHRFPNDPGSPVVRYMVNYNLMGDVEEESRSLWERIREVERGVSRVWSKFDFLTSWKWSRVKPSIDALTVPVESLKNSLNLIINVIALERLSSGGMTRSDKELELEIVFLKRIIRSQIETIRQLREDHHYIPVIMESPEAAVADPQLRLCHLAFSMAEKEKAPESSPDTFRFSKPRRRRSGMSENDHSSVGRQRSQRLSDIPRSPRVQLEGDDPSASRPLNKSSRRESRRSVPAPAAKEVERQAVPAAILTLAASAPRTARRVSNFESLSDKRDKTPEADKILPPEQPVQEGAIKPRHVVKEIKPLVEKQPVQSVEAPTPADQLISEHQEAEKESEEPGAKVSVAKHSPVNEEGTINVRRATKAEVGNSDDRTIEKIVVEEPSANAAADPPDAVVIEDGPVQDGVIIHHSEERHPSESKPDRYSLAEETPAAGKVLARERSVKTSILKERPVVNGVAEEWMAMGKARRSRRQSTTDGHSERRSVEKGLPEERRSGVDRTLAQEETSSRRSTAETLAKEQPAQAKLTDRTSSIRVEVPKGRPVEMGHARSCLVQQPRAEDQSTDAGAVEDLPVRRGSSETRGRPAEEIATSEKPVRYGPAILGEESVGGMREDRRSFHDQPAKVERTRRRSSDKRLAEEMQSSPEQLAQERLVQGHLGNQSSLRMMRRNGVKHGDTVRGYINIGSLHHQEAVAHVDRGIRKNLISRAFANELQLEIQGNPGVLFYGDEKMSSDGAVTFNWGDEEITCHVINKLESPLVFGRDFLAERKGGG